jgi:hypothetical protein
MSRFLVEVFAFGMGFFFQGFLSAGSLYILKKRSNWFFEGSLNNDSGM